MALPLFITAAAAAPIVATFIRFLVGTFIVRAIAALGISVVTYNITSSIGNMVKSHFLSLLSSGGGDVVSIANAIGVASAANIIFSAYMGALTIRAAMGLTKRMTFGNG